MSSLVLTFQMLQTQIMPSSKELNKEVELIKAETKCILDKVLELGKGDWAIGTVLAFKSGVLDVPFAPSIYTKKKILPVRDLSGAIRIFDFGDIPISREIKNYHSELIYQRSKKTKQEIDFKMVVSDINAISQGMLIGH